MSIGTGPDYYNGVDRVREAEQKLMDEIDEWWNNLDESIKEEIIETYYPDIIIYDKDEMWEALDSDEKLEAYKDNNGYNRGD